jgi:hypothetical protein
MKQAEDPAPPGLLQTIASLLAGAFVAIVCGNALLQLAIGGGFQFPLTRGIGHEAPVLSFADEPGRTLVWAGVVLVLSRLGAWLACSGWIGLRKKWWP